ncbi:DUF3443 domain-containing protein [Ramlibacter sp.]|uniref:DUF3443 domain-containing protein n=1 Tax=Ramlibacter sp. TaxID=1917967 RepID=UPI00261C1AF3|nr:DUF3443 domain-containing protein [Ramlibacter sp.]MDB5958129.1 hypothetical protein [Ramlibacter sp.]
MKRQPAWRSLAAIALIALLSGCGGGSDNSTTTPAPPTTSLAANQLDIRVDAGTDGRSVNSPYVTVTVCQPGTASCQTIDHVLLDTGSFGLRLAASAVTGVTLPQVAAPNGSPLAECAGFVSGFSWGSVRRADVQLSGEQAASIPVQLVDDPALPNVPAACSNTGTSIGVGAGAKGILGVGLETQDCGAACLNSTAPALYYACPSTPAGTPCAASTAPLASQVTNPVALFAADNNGVTIALPQVPLGGLPVVTGILTFGIGTQADNQLGAATVYTADSQGNITTVYKGRSLRGFVDSGSNGIFFRDTTLPCTPGFYCPPTPLTLDATFTGTNGATADIPFQVEDPAKLPGNSVVGHLAGGLGAGLFDWGLPFFFGRTVFSAIRGATTPAGPGPYWAF